MTTVTADRTKISSSRSTARTPLTTGQRAFARTTLITLDGKELRGQDEGLTPVHNSALMAAWGAVLLFSLVRFHYFYHVRQGAGI